jgi:molybdopterin converting factor small subunit
VKILLFGSLREDVAQEVAGEVPAEGCSIGVLREMLVARDPAYAPLARPSVLACVDREIVRDDRVVRPGQEIAFFRPMSGG